MFIKNICKDYWNFKGLNFFSNKLSFTKIQQMLTTTLPNYYQYVLNIFIGLDNYLSKLSLCMTLISNHRLYIKYGYRDIHVASKSLNILPNVIVRFLNVLPINKVNALGGWTIIFKI